MFMKDAPGMRGPRSRNEDGHLRRKRSDTQVKTIEKTYGIDTGKRSDMQLGNLLREKGLDSLDDLVNGQ
jgi:hypothetical protein